MLDHVQNIHVCPINWGRSKMGKIQFLNASHLIWVPTIVSKLKVKRSKKAKSFGFIIIGFSLLNFTDLYSIGSAKSLIFNP